MPAKDLLRKRKRSHSVRWFLVIVFLGFLYLSFEPVQRLRSVPPGEFHDSQAKWDPDRRALEERTAEAYWARAVQFIQWQQPYGTVLPSNPPEDFSLAKGNVPTGDLDSSPATRIRYWQNLREVWSLPHSWEKSYEFDMGWLRRFVMTTQAKIVRFVDRVISRS